MDTLSKPQPYPPADPAHLLVILDQALSTSDATLTKLRYLRYVLEGKGSLSDKQTAQAIGCSERTVRTAKQWVQAHGLLSTNPRKEIAHACSSHSEEELKKEHTMHGDPAFQLAQEQLATIDWGLLDGRPVQDPVDFIEQHGTLNVLYALWCSRGKRIQKPAAFVTWWCRQEGHQAPEGWLPVELRQPSTEALPTPPVPPTPVVPPVTPPALRPLRQALLDDIEGCVRPVSFRTWFAPLRLIGIEASNTLSIWTPNNAHAEWLDRHYEGVLNRAVEAMGHNGYRLTVPAQVDRQEREGIG